MVFLLGAFFVVDSEGCAGGVNRGPYMMKCSLMVGMQLRRTI